VVVVKLLTCDVAGSSSYRPFFFCPSGLNIRGIRNLIVLRKYNNITEHKTSGGVVVDVLNFSICVQIPAPTHFFPFTDVAPAAAHGWGAVATGWAFSVVACSQGAACWAQLGRGCPWPGCTLPGPGCGRSQPGCSRLGVAMEGKVACSRGS
jgi:hypothetical protein